MLVRCDGVHPLEQAVGGPQRKEIVDCGSEADCLRGHRDARLEPLRRGREGRALHPYDLDHRATREERWHRVEEVVAAPQDADAGRPKHLVAAEGEEVDTERGDVDRHVWDRLAGVEDDERTDRMRSGCDPAHWCDSAQHVALVCQCDDPSALGDDGVETVHGVIEIEAAVVIDADPAEHRSGLVTDLLPRHEIGVVLHLGHDNLVTRREHESLGPSG